MYVHTYAITVERELGTDERPLQIALDCSSKGLALPRFVLKTSLPSITSNGSLPLHHTSKFTSYVGPLAASMTSMPALRHNDISRAEPLLSQSTGRLPKASEGDHISVNSFGSANSSSSSRSGKGALKSTMSLPGGASATTDPVTPGGKTSLSHTLSNQESKSHTSPAELHNQLSSSPTTPRRYVRTKNVMTNFISRSLRLRKKSKSSAKVSTSFDKEGECEADTPIASATTTTSMEFSSLVSPLPLERKFTMSTVMQIYYTDARKAQLYKSVLVSEKATTREVITQALERYNLKLSDPEDFGLFEVIGKWQDVTHTLHTHKGTQFGAVAKGTATLGSSPLSRQQAVTSVEEFVVCYSRELGPHESPYSAQLYLLTQDGFTRRFELRPKKQKPRPQSQVLLDEKIMQEQRMRTHSSSQLDIPPPGSPFGIFGDTSHRRRARSGRRKCVAHDSPPRLTERPTSPVELPAVLLSDTSSVDGEAGARIGVGEAERDRDELLEIPINLNPSQPMDFSGVACNSPDSGVALHKSQADSTKSSVSSEQSEGKTDAEVTCSVYSPSLSAAFLLSLRLHCPEKEFLVHRLQSTVTYLTPAALSSRSPVDESNPPVNGEEQPQSLAKVLLHLPSPVMRSLASSQPICCICRKHTNSNSSAVTQRPEPAQATSHHEYSLQLLSDEVIVSVNGRRAYTRMPLHHGDLVAVGKAHLFMFQDYNSVLGVDIPEYNWWPHPIDSDVRDRLTPRAIIQEPVAVVNGDLWGSGKRGGGGGRRESDESISTRVIIREALPRRSDSNPRIIIDGNRMDGDTDLSTPDFVSPTSDSLVFTVGSIDDIRSSASAPQLSSRKTRGNHLLPSTVRLPLTSDDSFDGSDPFELSFLHKSAVNGGPTLEEDKSPHHGSLSSSSSSQLKDRKLMFSFQVMEEDSLLSLLVTRLDPSVTSCKLAPAYILAMCVEFSLRCNGPVAAARFVRKAADCIQEVVWVSLPFLFLSFFFFPIRDLCIHQMQRKHTIATANVEYAS